MFDDGANGQFWGRLKNCLRNIGNEFWYQGSNASAAGPAASFSLMHMGIVGSTGYAIMTFGFRAPYGLANNFDGMRYLEMTFYGPSPGYSLYFPDKQRFYIPDQRHESTGGVDNDSCTTFVASAPSAPGYNLVSGNYTYNGYVQCVLYNVTGHSGSAAFDCRTTAYISNHTYIGANVPGAAAYTPGGGSDGLCPAPWMKITLASGARIYAANLHDGAKVVGFSEHEGKILPRVGIVRKPSIGWNERFDIAFTKGRIASFSKNHRVVTDGGWKQVQDLKPGVSILAMGEPRIVTAVKSIGRAEVVSFQVEGCSTYFADDLACHNIKP
jgi:hypothetical protein